MKKRNLSSVRHVVFSALVGDAILITDSTTFVQGGALTYQGFLERLGQLVAAGSSGKSKELPTTTSTRKEIHK